MIFSLDFSDADFEEVAARFVAAGRAMREDGFFWPGMSNRAIKRRILRELVLRRFGVSLAGTVAPAPSDFTTAGFRTDLG